MSGLDVHSCFQIFSFLLISWRFVSCLEMDASLAFSASECAARHAKTITHSAWGSAKVKRAGALWSMNPFGKAQRNVSWALPGFFPVPVPLLEQPRSQGVFSKLAQSWWNPYCACGFGEMLTGGGLSSGECTPVTFTLGLLVSSGRGCVHTFLYLSYCYDSSSISLSSVRSGSPASGSVICRH